jgi:hypothetical protein
LYFGSIAYFFFVFFNILKNRAAKGNRYFGELHLIFESFIAVHRLLDLPVVIVFTKQCHDGDCYARRSHRGWYIIFARAYRPVPLYNV